MTDLSRWAGPLDPGPFRFRPPAAEADSVRVRVIAVPDGPCGYLVRDVPPEEWEEWTAQHGEEAASAARRYLETGEGEEVRVR